MPLDLFLIGLITALGGVSAAAAVALWPHLREWCEDSLFPWLEKNLPQLAPHVRDAFAAIDDAVTAVRRAVKQAWRHLRENLLKQVVLLQRESSSRWVRRVTSWVAKVLESGRRVPVQVVTEQVCCWEDLPAEVRDEWLRQGHARQEIDVTKLRDRELAAC